MSSKLAMTWCEFRATSGWAWCTRCKTKQQLEGEYTLFEYCCFAEEFAVVHTECKEQAP